MGKARFISTTTVHQGDKEDEKGTTSARARAAASPVTTCSAFRGSDAPCASRGARQIFGFGVRGCRTSDAPGCAWSAASQSGTLSSNLPSSTAAMAPRIAALLFHFTQFIYQMALESQLPHKIVILFFTITN